jgi:hypothetical protein
MGGSPFPFFFSFFGSFFLFQFLTFFGYWYTLLKFIAFNRFLQPFNLLLHNQKEAEAGNAEEQPARNISDYLSI